MYDLHETQPVRRSELRTPSPLDNVPPSKEVREQWQQQLDQVFSNGLESQHTREPDSDAAQLAGRLPDQSRVEAYEFRLFSSKAKTTQASGQEITKIRIESPTPVSGEPGFVRPRRSEDYYFTFANGDVERERYKEVAVDGERILKEAHARWPGFKLPWRVTTIAASGPSKPPISSTTMAQVAESEKRKRSGQKRRIAIRIRTQTQKGREDLLKRAEVDKEAMEREKRNRRNREKKVKRREKARAEKKKEDG